MVLVWLAWRCVLGGDENIFHIEDLFFFMKEPPKLLQGTLDSGVSYDVRSDRYSPENMLLEFGGVARLSSRTEGSDRDYLYFFPKNLNTRM